MPAAGATATHRLPQDDRDLSRETAWFFRLNPFQREHTIRQSRFLRGLLREESGSAESPYPHVLPPTIGGETDFRSGLYDAIADNARAYLQASGLNWEEKLADLRDSHALCLNVLFPFRENLQSARSVLRPMLPGVSAVHRIEFGFESSLEPDDGRLAEWLGETIGSRRRRRNTAVDAAIWWSDVDGPRITLAEWTYTECGFGRCPGLESCTRRGRNLWIRRCTNLHTAAIPQDPEHRCFMASGETARETRRYWEHMGAAGIDVHAVGPRVPGCVFRGPFHHLMRQRLLAEYVRQNAADERVRVDVCLVHFADNRPLFTVPVWMREMGDHLPTAWRALLTHPESYRSCSVEDLAAACDEGGLPPDPGWRNYIHLRYGV